MRRFSISDIRNRNAFPDLGYRFSAVSENYRGVELQRDFLGENPLHYYIDAANRELVVGSNIADIKRYQEQRNRRFSWERVRAVHNNTRVSVDDRSFLSASPEEQELGPTLQEYNPPYDASAYRDLHIPGSELRRLLRESVEMRLSTIPDSRVGMLLSGGLDSMSIAYLLSRSQGKEFQAYTLKVEEYEKDIIRSREIAARFGIPLTEVKVIPRDGHLLICSQQYDRSRKLSDERQIGEFGVYNAVMESLRISGNPKDDNLFCAISMLLIGKAIQADGVTTVFCGEGPNEMLNDYGYIPSSNGYLSDDIGDILFREALTFGSKTEDKWLGRGGLPKHALARMGKMFAHYDIRLESPYFDREIARIMTRVPHITSHGTIKQHLLSTIFPEEDVVDLVFGVSKEKFQDGSGVSRIFSAYDQRRFVDMFNDLYGIRKTGYLKTEP